MIDYVLMHMYLARVGLYSPTAEVLGSLIFQCVTALHNTRKCLPEAASEGSESGQLPDQADEHVLPHRPHQRMRNYGSEINF